MTVYPHGTYTAYQYGCRCTPCILFYRSYYRAWKKGKSGEIPLDSQERQA